MSRADLLRRLRGLANRALVGAGRLGVRYVDGEVLRSEGPSRLGQAVGELQILESGPRPRVEPQTAQEHRRPYVARARRLCLRIPPFRRAGATTRLFMRTAMGMRTRATPREPLHNDRASPTSSGETRFVPLPERAALERAWTTAPGASRRRRIRRRGRALPRWQCDISATATLLTQSDRFWLPSQGESPALEAAAVAVPRRASGPIGVTSERSRGRHANLR